MKLQATPRASWEPAPLYPLLARLQGDEKHAPAAHSTLETMWALYAHVLHVDPLRPDAAERDRFLHSKGHGPMAYYAALAWRGFFPLPWLDDFLKERSPLGGHPDRTLIPGVEISSGSLGHGLPQAVGVALALRARGQRRPRVFCLVGDGELDEGSNHEAIAFAGRPAASGEAIGRGMVAIVVDNRSASWGWPNGPEKRFEVEGWSTKRVRAQDHRQLVEALDVAPGSPPTVVVVRSADEKAVMS